MDYIGLFFELILLTAGIYLYLFAIGRLRFRDPAAAKKAEAFRTANGSWLRLAALALTAVMIINIIVHLRQLMAL